MWGGAEPFSESSVIFIDLYHAVAVYNVFWLTPWAINKQSEMLAEAKANPRFAALAAGQFMSAGGYVLFIDNIKDNTINDIYVFQPEQQKKNKPLWWWLNRGNYKGFRMAIKC